MGGQHDDGAAVSVPSHALDRLPPIEVGQADVHDDEVRRFRLDRMNRGSGRLDGLDLELRMEGELFDQRITQVGVIVHDQQSPRLGHWPYFIDWMARRLAQDCGKRAADVQSCETPGTRSGGSQDAYPPQRTGGCCGGNRALLGFLSGKGWQIRRPGGRPLR